MDDREGREPGLATGFRVVVERWSGKKAASTLVTRDPQDKGEDCRAG